MTAPSYLVLDIETIPDAEVHTPPEPAPGHERPFPPLFACRPVVIGVLWLGDDLACKRMGTIGDGKDEAGMLADFAEFMGKWKPHIITWNGRCFDLPVLLLRAMRHGVALPWYYRERDYRYRYSADGHLDLCDFLSDHGAARLTSLAGAAKLIGLPGKDGLDGSQVEGLYHAGQMDALRSYCLSDVAQTAFLFLRQKLLVGQVDRDTYKRVAGELLTWMEADGRLARLMGVIDKRRLLLGES